MIGDGEKYMRSLKHIVEACAENFKDFVVGKSERVEGLLKHVEKKKKEKHRQRRVKRICVL